MAVALDRTKPAEWLLRRSPCRLLECRYSKKQRRTAQVVDLLLEEFRWMAGAGAGRSGLNGRAARPEERLGNLRWEDGGEKLWSLQKEAFCTGDTSSVGLRVRCNRAAGQVHGRAREQRAFYQKHDRV
jgi:hypothetical protein